MEDCELMEKPIYPLVEVFLRKGFLVKKEGRYRFPQSAEIMRYIKEEYENEYKVLKAWLFIAQG